MSTIKIFRGDTFIVPTIIIASPNFTFAYLDGAVVKFQIKPRGDNISTVVITALPEHITSQVLQQPISYTNTNNVSVTETLWCLKISIIIPKELMSVSSVIAGEYYYDYDITYTNGIRKTYNQTKLIIKQDVSDG